MLLDGWLVLGKIPVALKAKVVISIGIFMFFAITVFIVTTLQQRYDGVAQVIRRINEVQMAYETGVFLDNETLMPKYWKRYGSSQWKEPIFHISYISLTTVCLLGISVVWFI